jgi:hypothetical protein
MFFQMPARRPQLPLSIVLVCTTGLLLSACSGAPEGQNQLGATDSRGNADAAYSAAETKAPATAQPAGMSSGRMPVSAITTGSVRPNPTEVISASGNQFSPQAPHTAKQRCEQLRQDGDVWQRTRNLAVRNRGEAGGRMADLHTPWTKENVTFYLAACNSRKVKSPATTENGGPGNSSAPAASSAKVASVRD